MADLFSGESAQATPFSFNNRTVRVSMRDGEPWFVCTDVAEALGYRNAPDASRHLDDEEKGTHTVRTPGGDQRVTIINESGLYALVLRSRKPEARKFAKWVTSEVLPSIRKTGAYTQSATERTLPSDLARHLAATIERGELPVADVALIAEAATLRMSDLAVQNPDRGYGDEVADRIHAGLSAADLHAITSAATMQMWLNVRKANRKLGVAA